MCGVCRLELEHVRLQGYGPFRDPVDYPLGGRGMVLIRGRNMDDPAAESNAAGTPDEQEANRGELEGRGPSGVEHASI